MTSLLWKEYRQHAWKILLGLIIFPPTYIALVVEHGLWGSEAWAGILSGAFGVLVATDIVAADRADGSVEFLGIQPVGTRKIVLAKLLSSYAIMAIVLAGSLLALSLFIHVGRTGLLERLDRVYLIRETGLPSFAIFLECAVLPTIVGISVGTIASAWATSEEASLLMGMMAFGIVAFVVSPMAILASTLIKHILSRESAWMFGFTTIESLIAILLFILAAGQLTLSLRPR